MKTRTRCFWLAWLGLVLVLAGCSSDNTDTHTLGADPFVNADGTPVVFAQFDGVTLPLPNDVAWADNGGLCPDGTVCLPPAAGDSTELATLKAAVNSLGLAGLSPNMFLTLPVTGTVDITTLELLVFRTDDPQLPVLLGALATNDLVAAAAAAAAMDIRTQSDFVSAGTSGVIKLLPKQPFIPGAAYAAVVRSTLVDGNGHPVGSSLTMQTLKQTTPIDAESPFINFEPLRAAFNDGVPSLFDVVAAVSGIATGTGWDRSATLVLWTFTTAPVTLTADGADLQTYPAGIDPAGSFNGTIAGLKTLSSNTDHSGSLRWLDPNGINPPTASNPDSMPAADFLGLLGIPLQQNPSPLGNIYLGFFDSHQFATGAANNDPVTFVLAVPAVGTPPYPVVVFQHGITSSKYAALAIAETLAADGYATLAIDAPLHGDRTTGASSGDGYFTTNMLLDRANIYQSAVDLWETVDQIEAGIDFDGNPGADLDINNVEFMAHSLGSIIGSVFLVGETRVNKLVLSSPSAILANVLDDISMPSIKQLVTGLGYVKGTTTYYVFLNLVQWLLDPIDAAYSGIGSHATDDLLSVYAFGDPIVAPSSSQAFVSGLWLNPFRVGTVDPRVISVVDPDDPIVPFSTPSPAAGTYQYGVPGQPIVHSFLLSPFVDLTEEPYYASYSQTDQLHATQAAQTQVLGFLALPPP